VALSTKSHLKSPKIKKQTVLKVRRVKKLILQFQREKLDYRDS
jgi:hypothetical protein